MGDNKLYFAFHSFLMFFQVSNTKYTLLLQKVGG